MGRMLDALKQPNSPTNRPVEDRAARPASPPPVDDIGADAEEVVSFIEVGGPRDTLSASPDVLAAPKPTRFAPPVITEAPPVTAPAPVPPVATAPVVQAVGGESPAAAVVPLKLEISPTPALAPWAVQFQPWATPKASRLAAELISFHQPDHAVSVQYRHLLQGLLAHLSGPRGQVLLFTAPSPWTGTTTVLLNLAVTAARRVACRVAAVDANLRRPALAGRLGIAPTPGLRDVLAGAVALPAAVQETGQPNLWALAAGRAESGEVRLPFDWLMPTLQQMREHFDLVFVDAPSWNEGSEVGALAAICDAVFMVLHQKDAPQGEKVGNLPGLRQPPTNLQGCILTMR